MDAKSTLDYLESLRAERQAIDEEILETQLRLGLSKPKEKHQIRISDADPVRAREPERSHHWNPIITREMTPPPGLRSLDADIK